MNAFNKMRTEQIITAMKKMLVIIVLFVTSYPVNAQDVITMKSGEELQVKVKKIGLNTIEYVRFDNETGPMYEISKEDVSKIRYQNGIEDSLHIRATQGLTKPPENTGAFLDERDNTLYKYVIIGDQTWLAENLKYRTATGFYRNIKEGCGDCCVFYDFEDALSACPEGWHLPSDDEWMELEINLGMYEGEATKKGWRGTYPGQAPDLLRTGRSGLNLCMCGYYYFIFYPVSETYNNTRSTYTGLNEDAFYWTSTEKNKDQAFYRQLASRASIYRNYFSKENLLPIRCVKD
jgi:uncharacterized protein (TIGR02145 family)